MVYSGPGFAEFLVSQPEGGVTKSHIVSVIQQDGLWLVDSF